MNGAIFKSVHQALAFSFLIQAHETSPENIMSVAIRRQLQAMGQWGDAVKTIDFGGLSPLEIRAQAAMVRLAVDSHLPKPEACAIRARYGLSIPFIDPDGTRSMRFTQDRIEAVRALVRWLAPNFRETPRAALAFLVARHVGECKGVRPTLQQIADSFGSSPATLHRAGKKISDRLRELENMGIARLEAPFAEHGLIQPHMACV